LGHWKGMAGGRSQKFSINGLKEICVTIDLVIEVLGFKKLWGKRKEQDFFEMLETMTQVGRGRNGTRSARKRPS